MEFRVAYEPTVIARKYIHLYVLICFIFKVSSPSSIRYCCIAVRQTAPKRLDRPRGDSLHLLFKLESTTVPAPF